MEFSSIKNLSKKDLSKMKKERLEQLFQAKMKNPLGQLGSPIQIRVLRRELARIETALMNQR